MPKLQTFAGVMKMFFQTAKEDWQHMDKKFYRIVFGAVGFVAIALFWYYFLRNFSPFGF